MKTQHTFASLAAAIALLGATAVFAADTPAAAAPAKQDKPVLLASASATAAGAAHAANATAAAVTAAIPAAASPAGRSREEVRAEAAEAVRNHRSTMSQQYDLLK